jgi:hypothetical protein
MIQLQINKTGNNELLLVIIDTDDSYMSRPLIVDKPIAEKIIDSIQKMIV